MKLIKNIYVIVITINIICEYVISVLTSTITKIKINRVLTNISLFYKTLLISRILNYSIFLNLKFEILQNNI